MHLEEYFAKLLREQRREMPQSLPQLLQLSRSTIETISGIERQLLQALEQVELLAARVERLATIPGVGRVVALKAVSYPVVNMPPRV